MNFRYGTVLNRVLIEPLIFLTAVLLKLVLAASDPASPES